MISLTITLFVWFVWFVVIFCSQIFPGGEILSKRPKIMVVGSSNTDLVVRLPRLPLPGETITSTRFIRALGGKGANQAVAAARLGAEVTLLCKLGRDDYGQGCYRAYQGEGIDLNHVVWDEETPSGVAIIFVDERGENMIGFAPGANMRLTAEEVSRSEAAIAAADCLLLQLEIPVAADFTAAQIARRHGVPVILNPAPSSDFPVELLDQVDVLTPNEHELADLLAKIDRAGGPPKAALAEVTRRVRHLVITLGARGCRTISGGVDSQYPAFAVDAVDTTGAGDAFNGGLAVALARGQPLAQAVRFASAVAALSVTRIGAQSSLPGATEVDTFLSIQFHT
jgi:ribokinase